ncbi:putative metalloprotease with PDZ domain [Filimonas zeae]|uniref:M61 family metallopeptidase n=1 Tax=Filimonas zeae TaxID=1737353 RepID=UPI001666FD70|nr:M61 family metallopeptidase [Filimonas zeae]MDR6341645.1 putative metalloprotease with PDZ domain [Filimonas zeae]
MKMHAAGYLLLALLFVTRFSFLYAQNAVQFHYQISMKQALSQRFQVTLNATGLTGPVVDLKMPVWMPGYYQLINYAAALDSFKVTDSNNQPVSWQQTSSSTWRIAHKTGTALQVSYHIKASQAFVAQPWLDTGHAYIAPTGIFLYAENYLNHPVTVSISPFTASQTVATGLPAIHDQPLTWQAANFDILYDSPFLIGQLEQLPDFTVQHIPHHFIGWQMGQFDRTSFQQDLKKIVTTASGIIGHIPYYQYTFLAIGPGRGGIEHLNSTTISFSGEELQSPNGRLRMLSFIAHEYFHHYNVKRIRPVALGPFDYSRENRTSQLWVSEGLTVYYEYMILRRAGIMSNEQLLEHFQQLTASYENRTGHLHQTLAQASEFT